ncbi:MAG: phage tail protein [Pyrinomonadaceae bacterium]|nr:phage tail protein [Pyrinomonadaceae bacterium]
MTEQNLGIDQFLGEIRIFGFGYTPQGWAKCDGQTLGISQNQALFSLLGTTYGGDGITTFALPNLKGRVPIHWGQGPGLSPYSIGQQAGYPTHALSAAETAQHNHVLSASTAAPNQPSVAGGIWANNSNAYVDSAPNASMQSGSLSAVGGQAHENMSPYLALNFCIAITGIFPSQN